VSNFAEVFRRTRPAPRLLIVHANHLSPDSPIPFQATIVYCPRTHAAFGHPPHPFREFLKRGVRVALGTDSLASNPDLSVLEEMRFIRQRYPDFPGDLLLRMGTLSGAEALGWADETGSIKPGKSADLAIVPMPNEDRDPHVLLFNSEHAVSRTMFRGKWVSP
jgi:cytosine/adenosine deaminase-related metal-dependent hydrolase